MILGIIIGYGLRRISFLRKVEVSISYTVFLFTVCFGRHYGSNRLIVDNLFSFGWQAALLAFICYCRQHFGFMACIKIVFHF